MLSPLSLDSPTRRRKEMIMIKEVSQFHWFVQPKDKKESNRCASTFSFCFKYSQQSTIIKLILPFAFCPRNAQERCVRFHRKSLNRVGPFEIRCNTNLRFPSPTRTGSSREGEGKHNPSSFGMLQTTTQKSQLCMPNCLCRSALSFAVPHATSEINDTTFSACTVSCMTKSMRTRGKS